MSGTIVCVVTNAYEGRGALQLASELRDRLDARLVLAHVANGATAIDGAESVSARNGRLGAEKLLANMGAEFGVAEADRRWAVGDTARLTAAIADEEAADMIVVDSRSRGLLRRGFLHAPLARELRSETAIPVLIAPPESPVRVKETTQTLRPLGTNAPT
jgi:nucleotide-binding universal stress UspA family protein